MDLLTNAVDMLPDGFPFSVLKNITRALAGESEGNLTVQIYYQYGQLEASLAKSSFIMN